MKHGSLFSGIGGFDLAAEWMGWENVFHCELNEFGQKVLKHYWPKAETFTDISKTDFTKYANTIDILTGGFPCQPYSTAGKRKGKEDERHLWPQMLRAVREISPRWIVGENVRGLTNWNGGMVFDEVQADLEAEGYEVLPFLLPACAVNAPHRRDRIWFVAHTGGNGQQQPNQFKEDNHRGLQKGMEERYGVDTLHGNGATSNTGSQGLQIGIRSGGGKDKDQAGTSQGREFTRTHTTGDWSKFPTESPLCTGNDGISERLDRGAISFSKWRNESIKAAGNAIVPQVAYEIFKSIRAFEVMISDTTVHECDATKLNSSNTADNQK